MIPEKRHIKLIRSKFAHLESKEDLVQLLTLANNIIYQKKCKPVLLKSLNYYSNPKICHKRYQTFNIKKKSGGNRTIHAPKKGLKSLLKALNFILHCLHEPHKAAHGFVPEKSIADNAKKHVGNHYVYNIDLENFFYSFDRNRVKLGFMYEPFKLNGDKEPLAFLLACLCTHPFELEGAIKTVLPQGSPTSPTISNILSKKLDRRLNGLAKRFGAIYTRYADDITFSSLHNIYEKEEFLNELHRIIEDDQNFLINSKKTRLQKSGFRQEVTGLVVNEKVNVRKRYLKQIRMWLYYWERYGYEKAEAIFRNDYIADKGHVKNGELSLENVLMGKLEFLKMVKGYQDSTYNGLKKRYDRLVGAEIDVADTNEVKQLIEENPLSSKKRYKDLTSENYIVNETNTAYDYKPLNVFEKTVEQDDNPEESPYDETIEDIQRRLGALEELLQNEVKQNTTVNDNSSNKNKTTTKSTKPRITHDPIFTYKILYSFKILNENFPFYNLVHGVTFETEEDYKNKIEGVNEAFKKIKNLQYGLYSHLKGLIDVYNDFGLGAAIQDDGTIKHPYYSNKKIPEINYKDNPELKKKYKQILWGDSKSKLKNFQVAVREFKKKCRFDSHNESTNLEKYLANALKDLSLNRGQLTLDLQQKYFHCWNNFSVNSVITWLVENITRHTNIDGNKNPDLISKDKRISIRTYKDENSPFDGYSCVTLEIKDHQSLIDENKGFSVFTKSIRENILDKINSICDFEVTGTVIKEGKKIMYKKSLLPFYENEKPKIIKIENDDYGITYRFKFVYDKTVKEIRKDYKKILIIENKEKEFKEFQSLFHESDKVDISQVLSKYIKTNKDVIINIDKLDQYKYVFLHASFEEDGLTEPVSEIIKYYDNNHTDFTLITYSGRALNWSNSKVKNIIRNKFTENIKNFEKFKDDYGFWHYDIFTKGLKKVKKNHIEKRLNDLKERYNEKYLIKYAMELGDTELEIKSKIEKYTTNQIINDLIKII